MNTTSDTPRTAVLLKTLSENNTSWQTSYQKISDLARELERELIAANKEVERLKRQ